MDLAAFFKAEFAEHHDVARRSEAALSGAFAELVRACVTQVWDLEQRQVVATGRSVNHPRAVVFAPHSRELAMAGAQQTPSISRRN